MYNQFNYGWNSGYTPVQNPQNNLSFAYIQGGKQAVNDYMVAPGNSVMLIDNEAGMITIKTREISGLLSPLREFKEQKPAPAPQPEHPEYITREEFEKRIAEMSNAKLSEQ